MSPEEIHNHALKHNLYKLFLSEIFNGRNESLPSAMTLIKSLSYQNGDLGWSVAIGTGGNYFCGYFSKSVAQKIFIPENALIAGSGALTGTAKKTTGGWMINGSWHYCSGCKNASAFTFI